jgi:hypothetical protein
MQRSKNEQEFKELIEILENMPSKKPMGRIYFLFSDGIYFDNKVLKKRTTAYYDHIRTLFSKYNYYFIDLIEEYLKSKDIKNDVKDKLQYFRGLIWSNIILDENKLIDYAKHAIKQGHTEFFEYLNLDDAVQVIFKYSDDAVINSDYIQFSGQLSDTEKIQELHKLFNARGAIRPNLIIGKNENGIVIKPNKEFERTVTINVEQINTYLKSISHEDDINKFPIRDKLILAASFKISKLSADAEKKEIFKKLNFKSSTSFLKRHWKLILGTTVAVGCLAAVSVFTLGVPVFIAGAIASALGIGVGSGLCIGLGTTAVGLGGGAIGAGASTAVNKIIEKVEIKRETKKNQELSTNLINLHFAAEAAPQEKNVAASPPVLDQEAASLPVLDQEAASPPSSESRNRSVIA